jgi:hypothetical protein
VLLPFDPNVCDRHRAEDARDDHEK